MALLIPPITPQLVNGRDDVFVRFDKEYREWLPLLYRFSCTPPRQRAHACSAHAAGGAAACPMHQLAARSTLQHARTHADTCAAWGDAYDMFKDWPPPLSRAAAHKHTRLH